MRKKYKSRSIMLYLVINFAVITGIAVFVNYWIIFGSFIGLYLEEMTENGEMIGVDDLLVSTGVQKALRVNFPKINSYAFGELWEMEYLDLVNLLSKAGLAPSVEELKIYDKDLKRVPSDFETKLKDVGLNVELSKETVKYGAKADDLFFVVTDKDGKPQLKSIMNIKLDKIFN